MELLKIGTTINLGESVGEIEVIKFVGLIYNVPASIPDFTHY